MLRIIFVGVDNICSSKFNILTIPIGNIHTYAPTKR